jgi:hypothetical protein
MGSRAIQPYYQAAKGLGFSVEFAVSLGWDTG